jgi:hypothetical protein
MWQLSVAPIEIVVRTAIIPRRGGGGCKRKAF